MSLPLFDGLDDEVPAPQAERLGPRLHAQSEKGIFWGTSSWKYPGWLGSLYSPERYQARGRFSKRAFEETCLAEYARTFPVVCGDFAFYQFPTVEFWRRLFGGTPEDFLFAFKVPEEITVPRWPSHARYGARAGRENEGFLDVGRLDSLFLERLRPYEARVATLIFEFGTMSKGVMGSRIDFFERLDPFLTALPKGFRYSVEIRNPEYLGDDYFALLSSHQVAHVFNAWTRMPEMGAQIALGGSFSADFTVARALLTKDRTYEAAVRSFEPYERVQEPNLGVRQALGELARASMKRRKPAFLFVNNRLEGHARQRSKRWWMGWKGEESHALRGIRPMISRGGVEYRASVSQGNGVDLAPRPANPGPDSPGATTCEEGGFERAYPFLRVQIVDRLYGLSDPAFLACLPGLVDNHPA